jgi:hypothetical protein
VDGIHYTIDEPRPFSTSYGSHKFGKKAALSYEFVISTFQPKLVWLNGPYPAATHDQTIFKTGGLKAAVELKQQERGNDFRLIADDGYFGEEYLDTLAFRNEFDAKDIVYYKDRALSRHESFNGKTKNFRVLKDKFRHDRTSGNPNREHPTHKACVEAICVTLQYEMDMGLLTLLDPFPN